MAESSKVDSLCLRRGAQLDSYAMKKSLTVGGRRDKIPTHQYKTTFTLQTGLGPVG